MGTATDVLLPVLVCAETARHHSEQAGSFSYGDALGTLLTLQGLLLSAAGLLLVVMQADQSRRLVLPVLTPIAVFRGVCVGGVLAGAGALAAWVSVFICDSGGGPARIVIATVIICAILLMAAVEALLLFSRRT